MFFLFSVLTCLLWTVQPVTWWFPVQVHLLAFAIFKLLCVLPPFNYLCMQAGTCRNADLKHGAVLWLHLSLSPLRHIIIIFSSIQPDSLCAQQASAHPFHPSLHSFIIRRLLNGAQLLTSDPFQWAMGPSSVATLLCSQSEWCGVTHSHQ